MAKSQNKRSARKRATARSTNAAKSSAGRRKNKPAAKKGSPKAAAAPPAANCDQPTPEDQAAYLETVIATGEAAHLDREGKLPAGATHKIVEDGGGNVKVVRRRFSMS